MKVQPKPVKLLNHPEVPAIAALVPASAPKGQVATRSYQQLVTQQGVSPERAKQLLGIK
jgi:hypothetical protein